MERKKINPVTNIVNKHITVSVPGSKSITNRAMLLATMAKGESRLNGALFSEDSRYFLKCLQDLGFETVVEESECRISVIGQGGTVPKKEASIYVGSAGTAARFLAAYLCCQEGNYLMDASEQMRKRPMVPLIRSLTSVGAVIGCPEEMGKFPMELMGKGICRHDITVNIDKSSQFLSALLISGCLSKEDLHIHIEGKHGMSYVQMTINMMNRFGVRVEQVSDSEFVIPAGQQYEPQEYDIEPDASAAAYFWAMAAMLGISVTVENIHFDSLQGDVAFVRILEQMGCQVEDTEVGITVTGPPEGHLKGIEVNMRECSDQAITLAAIAPFADSPVHITGILHIRAQESDRIASIADNLIDMGVYVEEEADGVTIFPYGTRAYRGIEIKDSIEKLNAAHKKRLVKTFDDHRVAMGFALTGLKMPGVAILNPMCCKKTFENYFEVFDRAVAQIQGDLTD